MMNFDTIALHNPLERLPEYRQLDRNIGKSRKSEDKAMAREKINDVLSSDAVKREVAFTWHALFGTPVSLAVNNILNPSATDVSTFISPGSMLQVPMPATDFGPVDRFYRQAAQYRASSIMFWPAHRSFWDLYASSPLVKVPPTESMGTFSVGPGSAVTGSSQQGALYRSGESATSPYPTGNTGSIPEHI